MIRCIQLADQFMMPPCRRCSHVNSATWHQVSTFFFLIIKMIIIFIKKYQFKLLLLSLRTEVTEVILIAK